MKIEIANARDGGTITLDGERVGYIESYRGGPAYVRFANQDAPEFLAYGTTEAVARIKYRGYSEAKKWARKALKAAGGDFKKLAARGKAGIWGDCLLATFTEMNADQQRIVDETCRANVYMQDKIRELEAENRTLKQAIEIKAA